MIEPAHAPVEMRTGRPACGANRTNQIAGRELIAYRN
jgi:hypothetical protein